MRKSKLSADEIEAADKAADNRRISRGNGFSLISDRDRGYARLSNDVVVLWHSSRELSNGEVRVNVPPGHFALIIKGQQYLFHKDEFQKWLRWA